MTRAWPHPALVARLRGGLANPGTGALGPHAGQADAAQPPDGSCRAASRLQWRVAFDEADARHRIPEGTPMTLRFVPARHLFALAAAALVVAGCSDDKTPTTPIDTTASQQDADDAAQQVGVIVGAENGVTLQPWIVPGSLGARRVTSPLGVTQDTTVHVGAVTWLLTRTFYDAGNVQQASFNSTTTARVTITGTGAGDVATATDTTSYGGAIALDVTGLLPASDSLRFTGTRHDTLTTSFESRFRVRTEVGLRRGHVIQTRSRDCEQQSNKSRQNQNRPTQFGLCNQRWTTISNHCSLHTLSYSFQVVKTLY